MVESPMIFDIFWVLLVVLIALNFRQYRKKDIEAFQVALSLLRKDLFVKLGAIETLLSHASAPQDAKSDIYKELDVLRHELAVIVNVQKRTQESDDFKANTEEAVKFESSIQQATNDK